MKRASSSPKSRVGLRDIAVEAKVCLMTVSLALRDSPKISPPTRTRIREIADRLGYHPDPELSRLMKHLRTSRTARGRTAIALLDFYPEARFVENSYNRRIRSGATARAEQLGFSVSAVRGADYKCNLRQMLKVVRARGIEGIVLLPSVIGLSLDASESWKGLSVVATSNSIFAPRFHNVVPHQFANMMRLLETIRKRGYQRVAAVFDEFFDERTAHNFTAALDRNGHGARTLVIPAELSASAQTSHVAKWLTQHEPELIFAQSAVVVDALASLPARRRDKWPVVWLGTKMTSTALAHLDERPDQVGVAAIDLLAGMMYYHENGIPDHPRTTMIDGDFHFTEA